MSLKALISKASRKPLKGKEGEKEGCNLIVIYNFVVTIENISNVAGEWESEQSHVIISLEVSIVKIHQALRTHAHWEIPCLGEWIYNSARMV